MAEDYRQFIVDPATQDRRRAEVQRLLALEAEKTDAPLHTVQLLQAVLAEQQRQTQLLEHQTQLLDQLLQRLTRQQT